MPRIRLALFPGGLNLNNDTAKQPEGTLRKCRNAAAFSGQGTLRSAPPVILLFTNMTRLSSIGKFNGRFITKGEVAAVVRYERQTTAGSDAAWTLLNHTTLTNPAVTLATSVSSPALFVTGQPTAEKDEHLFMLDPANTVGSNALLKLNDAGTLSHWGIFPPTAAYVASITSALIAQSEKYINTAASDPLDDVANWTLATADETALSVDTAISNSANPAVEGNSIKFIIGRDDNAQITRILGANVDLTTFGAQASSDEDFIQFYVRVRRPKHIQSVEIAFDTTVAGDFKTSFFSREVTFKLVGRRKKKKLIGLGDLIPKKKIKEFIADQSKSNDLTFTEEMGNPQIPVAKNTWTRITLPKNTFEQSGTPLWSTVRAIRFTVQANKEGKTAIFLDRLTMNGGAGMHGDYEYALTFSNEDGAPTSPGSRSNPAIDDDFGTTTGLRNSVVTHKIANVERQGVQLTLPAIAAANWDPQIRRIEIWRTLGNAKAFFKAGHINTGAVASFAGATFNDNAADYYGLNTNAATVTAGANVSFAVLDPTTELPLDNTSPNDPSFAFQDVADKVHLNRMWWGRNVAAISETNSATASLGGHGLVYYSPVGRLEAVQGYVYVTSGVSDPVQKLVVWNDRLFVFTKASMYEIIGTDEPFVAQKIEGAPGTLMPYTVAASVAGILWIASDGLYRFNGQFAENLSDRSLMPLFRHRLNPGELSASFDVNGRAIAGRNCYLMGEDAGAGNFSLIYDFDTGTFRYGDYASGPSSNSGAMIYDTVAGKLLVDGIAGGTDLQEVDAQTYPTSGTFTSFTSRFFLWRSGPGRQAILRKLWIDVTRMENGNSTSFSVATVIDHASTSLTTFNPSATADESRFIAEYNLNVPGELFEIEVSGNTIRNCRINAIEADIYAPEMTDEEK